MSCNTCILASQLAINIIFVKKKASTQRVNKDVLICSADWQRITFESCMHGDLGIVSCFACIMCKLFNTSPVHVVYICAHTIDELCSLNCESHQCFLCS